MKTILSFIGLCALTFSLKAQTVLSLDSCRALALANNKDILISRENIKAAHYEKKAAFTNFLPNISAAGGYMRSSKELSLLSDAQKGALSGMGTAISSPLQQAAQAIAQLYPELAGQLPALGESLTNALNNAGNSLVEAFRTDTRNMYAGALTLTQPLYMGGKIRAYNKITRYAEELARQQHRSGMHEVILSTDQAYWQVVSLANKKRTTENKLKLLKQMKNDINKMKAEGVATKADGLSVKVKVNEAEMTLTKVTDGLSLARMLLCQLCGLDLTTPVVLEDEQKADLTNHSPTATRNINMADVYSMRTEVRSLELAAQMYRQKVNIVRADYLPSVALIGGYMATNPSVFNSFENKFKGMWNVGVTVSLPIWHWGEGIYKVKAAKSAAKIAQYQLDDAKEKIELQVSQSAFQVNEAAKKLLMAEKNLEKANENLRYATLGFEEGVIPTSNVLEAHTAWLSAQSEKIDAQIDVKLTEIYLKKALGQFGNELSTGY